MILKIISSFSAQTKKVTDLDKITDMTLIRNMSAQVKKIKSSSDPLNDTIMTSMSTSYSLDPKDMTYTVWFVN